MSLKELHFQARKKINKIAADLKAQGFDAIHDFDSDDLVKVEWKAGQFYFDGQAIEFACAHKMARALAKGGPIESIVEVLPKRAEIVIKALKDVLEAPREEPAPWSQVKEDRSSLTLDKPEPGALAGVAQALAVPPAEVQADLDGVTFEEKPKAPKGRGKAKKG